MKFMTGVVTVAAASLFSLGCTSTAPDLGRIYSREVATEDLERNPVILIPGILGSSLVDGQGRLVWGVIGRPVIKPELEEGARAIALPMEGTNQGGLPLDDVSASGVLDRVRLRMFGVPFEIRAYANVLRTLGVFAGYRDESLGRSGAESAGSDEGTPPRPTWKGARRIERAILVAPPNAGSMRSFLALIHGRRFGLFSYDYSPAILGTFSSLYEMLPRSRHGAMVDAYPRTSGSAGS